MRYARIYKLDGKKEEALRSLKISPNFEAIPEGEEELALQKKIPTEPYSRRKATNEIEGGTDILELLKKREKELAELEEKIGLRHREYEEAIQRKTEFLVEEKHRAEEEKKRIFEETQIRKEELLEEARKEKQTILDEAEQRAAKIISEAESQKSTFEANGREAGRVQGFQSAKEEAESDINRLQEWLQKAAIEVHEERSKLFAQAERDVVQLCRISIRKIVKQLSSSDEKLIVRNVTAALALADKHSDLKIRVHPDDLAMCRKYSDDFSKQIRNKGNVLLIEDPSIERGGCFIESSLGAIDARISSQLHEIEMSLEKISTLKAKAL